MSTSNTRKHGHKADTKLYNSFEATLSIVLAFFERLWTPSGEIRELAARGYSRTLQLDGANSPAENALLPSTHTYRKLRFGSMAAHIKYANPKLSE